MKIRMIWGVPRFQGTEMGRLMPVAADLQEASWGLRCQQECRTRTSRPARHPARLEKYLWFLPRKRCPSPKQNAEFIVKNWCVTVVSSVEVGWSWDVASKDWDPSTKVTKERIELAMVATPMCRVGRLAVCGCGAKHFWYPGIFRAKRNVWVTVSLRTRDAWNRHKVTSSDAIQSASAWVALLLPFRSSALHHINIQHISTWDRSPKMRMTSWPANELGTKLG